MADRCGPVEKQCLQEASFAHLTRKTTEARRSKTASRSGGANAPKGGKMRRGLRKERKVVASRHYQPLQPLSGHATIGFYLTEKVKVIRSSEC